MAVLKGIREIYPTTAEGWDLLAQAGYANGFDEDVGGSTPRRRYRGRQGEYEGDRREREPISEESSTLRNNSSNNYDDAALLLAPDFPDAGYSDAVLLPSNTPPNGP
jgi:hypothetical protein